MEKKTLPLEIGAAVAIVGAVVGGQAHDDQRHRQVRVQLADGQLVTTHPDNIRTDNLRMNDKPETKAEKPAETKAVQPAANKAVRPQSNK